MQHGSNFAAEPLSSAQAHILARSAKTPTACFLDMQMANSRSSVAVVSRFFCQSLTCVRISSILADLSARSTPPLSHMRSGASPPSSCRKALAASFQLRHCSRTRTASQDQPSCSRIAQTQPKPLPSAAQRSDCLLPPLSLRKAHCTLVCGQIPFHSANPARTALTRNAEAA